MTLDDYLKRKAPPAPPKKPTWLERCMPKDLTRLVVAR